MTSGTASASWKLMVEPFGEGSTRRSRDLAARTLCGGEADLTRERLGPVDREGCIASGSESTDSIIAPGKGKTVTPRSAATVKVVVKMSTSTTTATSHPAEIACAPFGPSQCATSSRLVVEQASWRSSRLTLSVIINRAWSPGSVQIRSFGPGHRRAGLHGQVVVTAEAEPLIEQD